MIRARKRFHVTSLAVVTATALAACGGDSGGGGAATVSGNVENAAESEYGGQALVSDNPPSGGTFTWAMAAPVPHLDPTKAIGASLVGPLAAIYEPLMTLDAEGTAKPMLAESMESEDQKTWTMKLPTGVKFTDGTPFNAEAVVANTKNVAKETSESQQAFQARQIESVKAEGDDTVVFTLKEPWAQFPSIFADISSLAMVPSPTAYKKEGAKYGLKPVGVGPFMVKDFKPGQSVTLEKNPDYQGEAKPLLDTLEYVTLPEADARVSGMQTGEVDGTALRTPADIDAAKKAGQRVLTQPGYNYYTLYVNHRQTALKDPEVRKALSMAIDRQGINQAVFGGASKPMEGFFTSAHPNFVKTDNWPAFNEAEAKKIIDAYKAKNGNKPIELNMVMPGIPEMNRIAAVIQQQWAKVGVKLNYKAGNPSEMVSQAVSGKYEIQMRDSGIQPETFNRVTTNFYGESPASVVGDKNKALDTAIHDAMADPDKRDASIKTIQEELNSWLPQIPLVTSISAVGVSDKVVAYPGIYPTTSAESFRANQVAVKK